MLKLTDVVKYLLIINALVFVFDVIFPGASDPFALRYFESTDFSPVQIVTHFFMHGGFMHFFFNMFGLVMFGTAVEARWGPQRFLFYYFVCAFGAVILHMGYTYYEMQGLQDAIQTFTLDPSYDQFLLFFKENGGAMEYAEQFETIADQIDNGESQSVAMAAEGMQKLMSYQMNTPMLGASGAIYGILIAFGILFPETELMLIFLPIPIKAKYFIPLLLFGDLYLGLSSYSWDNIAHFAHLGGALFGFLLILFWRKFGSGKSI